MTTPTAPPNASKPTTAQLVGGVYNINTETLVDGQATPFQFDVNGKLLVNSSGGGGGGNVNITGINGNPPALGNPLPVELSDGTNAFGTVGNPLSVNVITGGGSNASVGTTGTTAPTSATEIGVIDGSGNLQGASSSNPVPVNIVESSLATSNMTGQAPGTAPADTSITGGIYNATPPTFTNGQTGAFQLDASGRLIVSVAAVVADSVNQGNQGTVVESWFFQPTDGTNPMGLMTLYGTAPAGYALPTNAFITNAPAVKLEDGSGNAISSTGGSLNVNVTAGGGANASVGTVGLTAPTSATNVGGVNALGQLVDLAVSPAGNRFVQDGTPGDSSVLKEILVEMRAMRKILSTVYEESGEGALAGLVDDVDTQSSVDYTN